MKIPNAQGEAENEQLPPVYKWPPAIYTRMVKWYWPTRRRRKNIGDDAVCAGAFREMSDIERCTQQLWAACCRTLLPYCVWDTTCLGSQMGPSAFSEMHAARRCMQWQRVTCHSTVDALSSQVAKQKSLAYAIILHSDNCVRQDTSRMQHLVIGSGRRLSLAGRSTDSQQCCAPLPYLT